MFKVDQATRLYVPNSFRKTAWLFHVPQESVKSCEAKPTVFRPYPRRLKSRIKKLNAICCDFFKSFSSVEIVPETCEVVPVIYFFLDY